MVIISAGQSSDVQLRRDGVRPAGNRSGAMPHDRYRPFVRFDLPDRTWPDRVLEQAPRWCSVDLRDGNQALVEPMGWDRKIRLFESLVAAGFREIDGCEDFSLDRTLVIAVPEFVVEEQDRVLNSATAMGPPSSAPPPSGAGPLHQNEEISEVKVSNIWNGVSPNQLCSMATMSRIDYSSVRSGC